MARWSLAGVTLVLLSACTAPFPVDSSSRAATTGETRLKVATWNLEWLADQVGEGTVPREDEDYARLKKYADRLDADIIALQEVEGIEGVSRVFDPAVYDIHIADNNWVQRTGFAYRKGLGFTVEPDYYDLSLGDSLRSGAVVRLDTDAASVRFMSVHLKASCPSGPLDASSDCERLAEQVPILEAWIDANAEQEVPFVILGDFNRRFFATSNEEFWTEIDDADPANADLYSPTEGHAGDCWGWTDYIDHIVLDRQATQWWADDSFVQQVFDDADSAYESVLSDHCPIASDLVIPGSGGDSGDGTDDQGDGSDTDDTGDTDDTDDTGGTTDNGDSGTGDADDTGDPGDESEDSGETDDTSDGEDTHSDDSGDTDDTGETGDTSDSGESGSGETNDGDGQGDTDTADSSDGPGSDVGDDTPPPMSGGDTFEASCSCRAPTHGSPLSTWTWLVCLAVPLTYHRRTGGRGHAKVPR